MDLQTLLYRIRFPFHSCIEMAVPRHSHERFSCTSSRPFGAQKERGSWHAEPIVRSNPARTEARNLMRLISPCAVDKEAARQGPGERSKAIASILPKGPVQVLSTVNGKASHPSHNALAQVNSSNNRFRTGADRLLNAISRIESSRVDQTFAFVE